MGGMNMKHFKTEEWIDYLNQVTSPKQQEAMQKHLATSCRQCKETVALWHRIQDTAAKEASYQPSAAHVRIAKAAFSATGRAVRSNEKRGFVELLFDSSMQPLLAGARSGSLGSRQMLYRADPYQIDIQIEAKPEGDRLVVTGQLLDVSTPGIVGRDVKITLSNHRGNVVHTISNQFGEFSGEVENTGDLELSFPAHGDNPIVISLRNALGNLPGNKA
jgi:hypothetical protein